MSFGKDHLIEVVNQKRSGDVLEEETRDKQTTFGKDHPIEVVDQQISGDILGEEMLGDILGRETREKLIDFGKDHLIEVVYILPSHLLSHSGDHNSIGNLYWILISVGSLIITVIRITTTLMPSKNHWAHILKNFPFSKVTRSINIVLIALQR